MKEKAFLVNTLKAIFAMEDHHYNKLTVSQLFASRGTAFERVKFPNDATMPSTYNR